VLPYGLADGFCGREKGRLMKKTLQFSDGGDSGRSSARDGSDGVCGGANQREPTLPLQYFSRAASQSEVDGELRLMLAVLKDGIDCFLNGHLHDDGGFLEAQQWIMAGNQAGPFAYDNICETLGIEPQSLRARLKSLRRLRQQAGVRSNWPVYFSGLRFAPQSTIFH